MTVNDSQVTIPRHLAISTRVNPNAFYPRNRRLQVRARNKADDSIRLPVPQDAVADIVAAQLFGFFKNLRLRETARAIALSVQRRGARRRHEVIALNVATKDEALHRSNQELRFKMKVSPGQAPTIGGVVILGTELGDIEVAVARPTVTLVQQLCQAETSDELATAIVDADRALDNWVNDRRHVSQQPGKPHRVCRCRSHVSS